MEIPLTHGLVAVIDDDDAPLVAGRRWYATSAKARGPRYAVCWEGRVVFLHHVIVGSPPVGQVVDHINRDSLDNRRVNLRFISRSANLQNAQKRTGCLSRFKGVTRLPSAPNKWAAQIQVENQHFWLGFFDSEEDAAMAYDAEVRRRRGPTALTNFS